MSINHFEQLENNNDPESILFGNMMILLDNMREKGVITQRLYRMLVNLLENGYGTLFSHYNDFKEILDFYKNHGERCSSCDREDTMCTEMTLTVQNGVRVGALVCPSCETKLVKDLGSVSGWENPVFHYCQVVHVMPRGNHS